MLELDFETEVENLKFQPDVSTDHSVELKRGHDLGIFDDIDNEDYHRGPGISKTGLDWIAQNPAYYLVNKENPTPKTQAQITGVAFHVLVLEPDIFDQQYMLAPTKAPRRPTKPQLEANNKSPAALISIAYWQNFDADNAGKIILSNEVKKDVKGKPKPGIWGRGDWDTIHYMRDAIDAHPEASVWLKPSDGVFERSIYWIDREFNKLCKSRMDFHNEVQNFTVDLKTTICAGYSDFGLSIEKYRYHVQHAMYTHGMYQVGKPVDGFIFVAVEKEPNYGIGVYELSEDDVSLGHDLFRRDLKVYAKCHDENEWPSYPSETREMILSQRAHYPKKY